MDVEQHLRDEIAAVYERHSIAAKNEAAPIIARLTELLNLKPPRTPIICAGCRKPITFDAMLGTRCKCSRPKHKFEVGEHVAIHGRGPYYGQNGVVREVLRDLAGEVSYAVKVLTGPDRDMKGTTVIAEADLRKE